MTGDEPDLGTPAGRERLLGQITPGTAKDNHAVLRQVLAAETAYAAGVGGYDERLLWVAFLLFCVGDPADTPALYDAKHSSFDAACGLDVLALVGAGVEPTLTWLRENGRGDIADALEQHRGYGDLDNASEWRSWREGYFYAG